MANGIARKRVLGITKETTFGTDPGTPTYILPCLDKPTLGEEVTMAVSEAMVGSVYKNSDSSLLMKQSKVSFKVYVDEKTLPLLLLNFGTATSALVASETLVYAHTIAFTHSNQKVSYTLYLDDTDRGDLIVTGFRVEKIDFTVERGGFVTAEVSGVGKYPVTGTITPTIENFLLFNANHGLFKIADTVGALATVNLLGLSLKHSFGISGDDDNFYIGGNDSDLDISFNTEAEFEHEVTLLLPDYTYKNKWAAGTKQAFSAEITDTSRNITGSTQSTKPSIAFVYPVGYLDAWQEDGGLGDVLKQKFTIKVLDDINTSSTPMSVVVKNAVASY